MKEKKNYIYARTGLTYTHLSSQEPEVCHKHLGRLFPGVGRLVHGDEGRIVELVSPQREVLHLAKVCYDATEGRPAGGHAAT